MEESKKQSSNDRQEKDDPMSRPMEETDLKLGKRSDSVYIDNLFDLQIVQPLKDPSIINVDIRKDGNQETPHIWQIWQ